MVRFPTKGMPSSKRITAYIRAEAKPRYGLAFRYAKHLSFSRLKAPVALSATVLIKSWTIATDFSFYLVWRSRAGC